MTWPSLTRGDPEARRGRDTVLVILVIAIFQFGTGILGAVVPVRLAASGMPAGAAGFVVTAYSAGFMLACLFTPGVSARTGPYAVFAGGVVISVITTLALWSVEAGTWWALNRIFAGAASGAFFTLIEAWLADRAPANRRGAAFSGYMGLNRTVFAIGQLSLAWFEPTAGILFVAAAAAFVLASTPMLAIAGPPPPTQARRLSGVFEMVRHAPAAAAGAFFTGAATTPATNLFPLWARDHGVTVEGVAVTLVAIQVAAIACQIPLAFLADRIDRRRALVTLGLAVLALSCVGPWLSGLGQAGRVAAVGLWAGLTFSPYPLAAAHMGDIARPEQRVAWGSSLLLLWGIGSMSGPLVCSLMMQAFGTGALFAFIGGLGLAMAAFVSAAGARKGSGRA